MEFIEQSDLKQAEQKLENLISTICTKLNTVVVLSPVNEYAYLFLQNGFVAKPKEIENKTSINSIGKGYIEAEVCSNSNYILKQLEQNNQIAIKRGDHKIWSDREKLLSLDKPITVLADRKGRYLTADIDILMMARKASQNEEIFFDQEFGFLSENDLKYILLVNSEYNRMHCRNIDSGVIRHGPYNKLKSSRVECIEFPLRVFIPKRENLASLSLYSLTELKEFVDKLKKYEYHLEIPSHWIR